MSTYHTWQVELAAHCGRLAAATRLLLEAHESNRDIPEALARVALNQFDQWSNDHENTTRATVSVLGESDGGPREEPC